MKVEIPLLVLSLLVIFSYLFDFFARRSKIPSILLLLISGIGLQYAARYFEISTQRIETILPLLGTVGLILIVLEGALELKLTQQKRDIIKKSISSAFFILLITTLVITLLIFFLTDAPLRLCFINAVPFSIISSAVAIPSTEVLPQDRKEFIVYESSLSDIFGIMLFNFALSNENYGMAAYTQLIGETVLIMLLAAGFSLILIYLLGRITHKLKFFLVISVLVLAYSFGKFYHLSSLIIVLVFGLFINNAETINLPWFKKIFMYDNYTQDLDQMNQLSGESAFLVRTFFFLVFGISINLPALLDNKVWITGGAMILCFYLIRFLYHRFFLKNSYVTELFIAPRGLISILLLLSIPDGLRIPGVGEGEMLLVIIMTSLIMTIGLRNGPKTSPKAKP